MNTVNRRYFLKTSGLGLLPGVLTALPAIANGEHKQSPPADDLYVKFFYDGEFFDGSAYWQQLQQLDKKQPIEADRYGQGGAVAELEKRFAAITGKEMAIYMPTGTMANQLAIVTLSGEAAKVFVQDTSHVYRDEADAAQTVFNKRLMPLAKNETFFTAAALQQAIENLDQEEVFKSGVGCVSVENPVRRSDGRMVPVEEIKKISAYCRSKNIKLHLDGARIYIASAWSGISVKEYASYFDTVYISMYKYLGASGGAILCGDKAVIEKMPHLVKVHGGNMFGNWLNAAMVLHRLEGVEERWQEAIGRSKEIFASLNQLPGIKITALDGGTNIYSMKFSKEIDIQKLAGNLSDKYFIRIPRRAADANGEMKISVNETWLYRDAKYIVDAFKEGLKAAG
jgi:threonine aldolase